MTVVRVLFITLLFHSTAFSQDTLRVSLADAEKLLIERNLSLITSRYQVDIAAAAKIQAKLFTNPELSTEWSLHNPAKDKWLDVGRNGQKIIALQKVFQIAGQRGTSVKLADEVKRMTEFQYETLVRSLRLELHATFYRYYFLNHAVSSIESQLKLLKNLITVYTEQYNKGNISLQELTRLNTTYFNINKQVKDVQQEQVQLQETLKVLLSDDRFIVPDSPPSVDYRVSNMSIETLIEQALAERPEIRSARSQRQQNELRYALAKKEAMPDLTAGVVYDQAGSYVNNYTAVTLGLRLPVFNRNQGQIQMARVGIVQGEALQRATEQQIKNEVRSSWQSFNLLLDQFNEVGANHEQQLNQLSAGLVSNYSKNNISLLEFTDLFEAYNTNIIQYNQLKADLIQSYEELIYVLGKDLNN